jgi:LmbE family N-acetylglucosaminyl deacetylase
MARFLYVFPHPDDESFGPAAAMHRQRREGHEVHLLTLTRGGATKVRHALGLSVEEMGAVRRREMEAVAAVLDLSSLTVLDLPDSGLAAMDPRSIEVVVRDEVERLEPDVVVTYPVHGISGFFDHLVTHAVVKRAWCELRDGGRGGRRLAFHTLAAVPEGERPVRLTASPAAEIDCLVAAAAEDLDAQRRALACYETYRDTIARIDPMSVTGDRVAFEIFDERHDPPLDDLAARLP